MVFIISDFWRKQKKVTIHLSPNFSPKPYQTFSTSITERVVLSTFFVTAKCFPRASHVWAAGGRRTSAYYEEDENRSKSLQRLRTSLWEPFMKLSDTDRVLFRTEKSILDTETLSDVALPWRFTHKSLVMSYYSTFIHIIFLQYKYYLNRSRCDNVDNNRWGLWDWRWRDLSSLIIASNVLQI